MIAIVVVVFFVRARCSVVERLMRRCAPFVYVPVCSHGMSLAAVNRPDIHTAALSVVGASAEMQRKDLSVFSSFILNQWKRRLQIYKKTFLLVKYKVTCVNLERRFYGVAFTISAATACFYFHVPDLLMKCLLTTVHFI